MLFERHPLQTSREVSRWLIVVAAVMLCIAGALAYVNSFTVAFLSDDFDAIRDNYHIRTLWPLSEATSWSTFGDGTTTSGRPILSLSFALNRYFLGPGVWGYHLVNLVIHLVAALLLMGIVRRTLLLPQYERRWGRAALPAAFATALLWVLHPLQVDSVTYMVQRAESLCGMLYLLTLYLTIRGFQSPHPWRWYAPAIATCALGMGTKEVMGTAPFMVLAYDTTFNVHSLKALLKKRWGFYLSLMSTLAIVAGMVYGNNMYSLEGSDFTARSPWLYALNQPRSIVYYLRLTFFPYPLLNCYDWDYAEHFSELVLPGLAILVLLLITGWGLIRRYWFGFVGAWFFLILGPSSSFAATKRLIDMHRMYLSIAAIALLAVLAGKVLADWLGTSPARRNACAALLLCVLVTTASVLGYLTRQFNARYHSELTLAEYDVSIVPESAAVQWTLGVALVRAGRPDEALKCFKKVQSLRPQDPNSYNDLGTGYAQLGLHAEALGAYLKALELNPEYASVHSNLSGTLVALGRFDQAIEEARLALRYGPRKSFARVNWGKALAGQGKWKEAEEQYREAMSMNPRHPLIPLGLGRALAAQGRRREAIEAYERSLELQADNPECLTSLGYVLAQEGRLEEAIDRFQEALRQQHDLVDAHLHLGRALAVQGRIAEGAQQFQEVLLLEPDHFQAQLNLGKALLAQGKTAEALVPLEAAVKRRPQDVEAQCFLAGLLTQQGRFAEARPHYQAAVQAAPQDPTSLNGLAWLIAIDPRVTAEEAAQGVQLAQQACAATNSQVAGHLDTLAAALAAAGRYNEAVQTAQRAEKLARDKGQQATANNIAQRVKLYQNKKPFQRKDK